MGDELYKSVEIDGEQYTIKKFTAITGLQIAKLLASKLMPVLPYLESGEDISAEAIQSLLDGIGQMSDADVEGLVKKCLKSCYKQYPAGPQPVIDSMGNFGVEGIEFDIVKTCRLCMEAISWGTADFFGAKGLISGKEVGSISSQPNP